MKLLDTIAAISTPHGKGGVALIRISGSEALSVAQRVFYPATGGSLGEKGVGRMTYGGIRMPDGKEIDPSGLSLPQMQRIVSEIVGIPEGNRLSDFIGLLC